MLLAESRERALAHWLDSEQWASVLKAAVPWCVPRCAAAVRTVIQCLSLPGLGGTNAAGEGRALALRGRAPAAVLPGLLTQKAKARQSSPPSPQSSPLPAAARKEGEGRGGGGRRTRRLPGGGREGRVLGCARPGRCSTQCPWRCPPPAPYNMPPRTALAQVSGSPTMSDEGVRSGSAHLGRPVLYYVHPLCTAPGSPSLWRGVPVAHHQPRCLPPKPADEWALCQARTLGNSCVEGTRGPVWAPPSSKTARRRLTKQRSPHFRILYCACPERSRPSRQPLGSFQGPAFESLSHPTYGAAKGT
ncbi:uncharacterized protein LOC116663796 [Camelus ferus]|uniref:Uncharacterized protein LOC116663796 n=1 Tax=Camelus ferus TaxID=419612 RepID=A0A8B8T322_CAMFR|nr:uncharacterized protein LOC116663796 [Camelus ferus]XP_032336371.1 uncharacterized protein LOC116663796 [Camelus ferus]XP_032336372.1 uncharacterized protein LOC116663796 [Camelus ferus]